MKLRTKYLPWIAGALTAGGVALYLRTRRPFSKYRVYTKNGILYGPGLSYRLTSTDLLWLGRAVIGEVAESESAWNNSTVIKNGQAVIWALAQNHMLAVGSGNRRPRYSTFTGLIRAYCQPINPIWMDPKGEKCQRNPTACTAEKIARRQRISGKSWEGLPAKVRELVNQFAAGSLPNPVPEMTDWAARDWPGWQINIGGNRFGVVRSLTLV